eukprot:TRINITY_DN2111_c0_g2_i2.p1 TRINITY_DN2111_c0_g2~~TRINITY_DN2111_c0_g2_i2.p1  ORF type:complete len:500 (+),score=134.10 TRINITY_DN2111_c0_g2_i2:1404-2903(+)
MKKKEKKHKKKKKKNKECGYCHIPYDKKIAPYQMKLSKCAICKKSYVPETILTTIEPVAGLIVTGKATFLEARVCREKKKAQNEANAQLMNEALPFVEYDLHRQIMCKLRVMGLNAAFGLKYQLAISDNLIIAIATATAMYLPALPAPQLLRINRKMKSVDAIADIESKITELSKQNQQQLAKAAVVQHAPSHMEILSPIPLQIRVPESQMGDDSPSALSDDSSTDGSEKEDESQTYIVDVDDEMDEDIMLVLLEPALPQGFQMCNTESLPGQNFGSSVQLITAIRRVEWDALSSTRLNHQISAIFYNLYGSLVFRLRSLTPCTLCSVNVEIQLPDDTEVQIVLTAMVVLDAKESLKEETSSPDLLFPLESTGVQVTPSSPSKKDKPKEERRALPQVVKMTPMSYIPESPIVSYLGRVNVHFIKESSSSKREGGVGYFSHVFLNQVNSIIRAEVLSRGGNALVGYRIEHLSIVENSSRNQSYSLISIVGDAVLTEVHGV